MTNGTAIFRSDLQASVLRAMADASVEVTASDLARSLDRPLSTVAREVRRLTDAGMVVARQDGRSALLRLDDTHGYVRAAREAFRFDDAGERDTEAARGRWWPTVAETAAAVRDELDAGDEAMALRLMLDGVNQLADAARAGRVDEALEPPGGLGDERWDTLLAASVRYVARRVGFAAPPWTVRAPLDSWWWPAGEHARAAMTVQQTPIELKRLGIWFSERNFVTL